MSKNINIYSNEELKSAMQASFANLSEVDNQLREAGIFIDFDLVRVHMWKMADAVRELELLRNWVGRNELNDFYVAEGMVFRAREI